MITYIILSTHIYSSLQETDDLQYEEELLRNPFSVKHWLRYTEHKKDAKSDNLNKVYERALLQMPGSYKLWHQYVRWGRHSSLQVPTYYSSSYALSSR